MTDTDYEIPIGDILPDSDNIREILTGEPIEELASSIRELGQLQSITVYPIADSGLKYRVWMGHRRHAALTLLHGREPDRFKLARCRVEAPPTDELARLDKMTAENLQRQQLNPIEEARLYKRYVDQGLKQGAVAVRLNVAASKVSNYLQLLDFSLTMQRSIASGQVTPAAAIAQMRHYRQAAGVAQRGTGVKKMSANTPYFNPEHKLHRTARECCQGQPSHAERPKLGAACGPCWEYIIIANARMDAGDPARVIVNEPAPVPPPPKVFTETFDDPREILRRLLCLRCGASALGRDDIRCATRKEMKLISYPKHLFRAALAPKP